jgi:hypothetical protein
MAAAATAAPPPAADHLVTMQAQTDTITLTGYTVGVPLTVQVLRGSVLIGTSQGTNPIADPHGSLAEVNSPLGTGVCWQGFTPDLLPGDVVRVTQSGAAEDAVVQDVTVGMAVADGSGVKVVGTALSPNGTPLPVIQLDELLLNPSLTNRRLRAPGDGNISSTPPPTGTWTAKFLTLTSPDVDAAVAAESVATWTSALGTEATEATASPTTPGPQGLCTAPLLEEGVSSVTPPAFLFDTTSLTIGGVAKSDAVSVSLRIEDTNPFTADVVTPHIGVSPSAGARFWATTLPAASILPMTDGALTVTPTFTTGASTQRTGTPLTFTKDMVIPDRTPPVASIVSGPKPFAKTTVATFDLASTETGTFQCKLDAAAFATCGDPVVFAGLAAGSHTFVVRALDAAKNVSLDVSQTWVVDLTAPRALTTVSAAQRRLLARSGLVIASTKCNEQCVVTVEAKLVMPGATPGRAKRTAKPVTVKLGGKGTPRVALTGPQRAAVQRSLRTGRTVQLFLNVTAVDQAGNRAKTTKTVRLTLADLR